MYQHKAVFLGTMVFLALPSSGQHTEPHIDTLTVDTFPIHHSSHGTLGVTGRTLQLPRWKSREGHNIIYRPNGTKYLEGDYTKENDSTFVRNGQFTLFNEDGSIQEQGTFRNGDKAGLFKVNDKNGTPLYTIDIDREYKTLLFPDGTTHTKGRITVSATGREFREGKWKYYCPGGSLRSQANSTFGARWANGCTTTRTAPFRERSTIGTSGSGGTRRSMKVLSSRMAVLCERQ